MSVRGEYALREAVKYLGIKESPAGSNSTVYGRWFGLDGAPWCAIFVSYCYAVGAGYIICQGFGGPGKGERGNAYVPTIESWLKHSGYWLGKVDPQPGDIAIFNWDGKAEPEHIGIVEKSLGGGVFLSIEGNTSTTSNSNGGEVMRRQRFINQCNGFGRIPDREPESAPA